LLLSNESLYQIKDGFHRKATGASAGSDGYSKTWHLIFMIAGNGHFSEAKSANIQVIVCIFPLRNEFVRNSGCTQGN
jgi:hypothetical protein